MKLKSVLAALALLVGCVGFAQEQSQVLLTIENQEITVEEFMAIYNKNNVEIETADKKSIEDYLDLYLNFKLKVQEAEVQGLDTVASFKKEFEGYVDQLAKPYLVDNQFTEGLIEEAYERSKWEINAKHIMVTIPENPTPKDTAVAWIKINEIYKKALTDSNFSNLAVEYSDDPSVVKNGGDLGYFSAFRMVYPFETAAYTTPLGSVSKPIRTSFGYHIIQVIDKRAARGEIKAAHIMVISNEKTSEEDKVKAEKKINEIYEKVKAGEDFSGLAKTYSDDRGSAKNGGDLGWFGAGRMVPSFEEVAFGIKNNGEYSEPFLTQFGWHIIKREDKRDLGTYEEEYESLSKKVQQDSRSLGSEHSLVQKLMVEYKVKIKESGKTPYYTIVDSSYFKNEWSDSIAAGLNKAIITINDKVYGKQKVVYTQSDFTKFLVERMGKRKPKAISMLVDELFTEFVDATIIAYEKSVLVLKYPEYKALVTEYHDGILLFEIMEKEVWKKAISDSTGLENFYKENQANYMWKERLNVVMYTCNDEPTAEMVMKMVKEEASDSTILETINKDSELAVHIRKGKFEKGEEPNLETVASEKGISIVNQSNKIIVVQVLEVVSSEPKELDEVRGLVTSAYQDKLDEEWLKELHEKYTYTINQEVLNSLEN